MSDTKHEMTIHFSVEPLKGGEQVTKKKITFTARAEPFKIEVLADGKVQLYYRKN